tara:strand:- start:7620 stop:8495 length:876 start_codon:yes stop_codon:yes gene_type:complete
MITETGKKVQEFYNKTPFPDYELSNFRTKEDLELAAYDFAKVLDRSIPKDASIIDIGTGTGQLSAYLSLHRDKVWGIDFSDSSLAKAKALKKKLKLDSWTLKKVDILDKKQIEEIKEQFDYVISMGVLHHTGNAYQAFQNILSLAKPRAYIGIGLYNTFGRLPLKRRIFLSKTIYKNNDKKKDKYIKMQIGDVADKERARGWWNDQYRHVHETTHTVGEVIKWYKKNNIEYYHTVPNTRLGDKSKLNIAGVWNKNGINTPNILVRAWKQLTWIWKTNKEGGYWITFGRFKE